MIEFDKVDSVLIKGDNKLLQNMLTDLKKEGTVKDFEKITEGQYGIVRPEGKRDFRKKAKDWAKDNHYDIDIQRETLSTSDYRGLFSRCYVIDNGTKEYTVAFAGFGWGDVELIEKLGGKEIAKWEDGFDDIIIAKIRETPSNFCKTYFDAYVKPIIESIEQEAKANGTNPDDRYSIDFSEDENGVGWAFCSGCDVAVYEVSLEGLEDRCGDDGRAFVEQENVDSIIMFHED